MAEFVVPVFIAVEADSAAAARELVIASLSDDGFEWPMPVLTSCVGNLEEVQEEDTPRRSAPARLARSRAAPRPSTMTNGPRSPVGKLVRVVLRAIAAYDASGDHQHAGGPYPGDCLRCALEPFEAAVREANPSASRKA